MKQKTSESKLIDAHTVIVCPRCGEQVIPGQQVQPIFSATLVRWLEHPVLSRPPAIDGVISIRLEPSRNVSMSVGDQLRQRAAMGGVGEQAQLAAFEEMLSRCLADAIAAEMQMEAVARDVDVSMPMKLNKRKNRCQGT